MALFSGEHENRIEMSNFERRPCSIPRTAVQWARIPGFLMMTRSPLFFLALFLLFFFWPPACRAQGLLNKNVSVSVRDKTVAEVLKLIEKQGEFSFSYNTDMISGDSLVSVSIGPVPVRQLLDQLLSGKFRYKEKGNFIVIQPEQRERYYQVSGQVLDGETGKEVDYASVYSKKQLVSALTDDAGFFKLRLGVNNPALTISKIGYADTTIVLDARQDAGVKVILYPKAVDLDTLIIKNAQESNFWLTRLFVSSRLRVQSRNISRFFISLPFQGSLTPGLSTHGRMSSQIVNKFSLNIYGGYTAGLNGVELGGLFNISKKDARYLQMATTFNAVSGKFGGVQIAGIYNQVLDSLKGVQLTGMGGFVKKQVKGVQASGAFNIVSGNMHGLQISLGGNLVKANLRGVQASLLGNISKHRMQGLQFGGLFNYAGNMKGVQVGLINLADSSSGYSIGFINIVKNGRGSLTVYATELVPWNLSWKSGSRKLHTVFNLGASLNGLEKAYVLGFGFGREVVMNQNLKLNTDVTVNSIFLGAWKTRPVLYRLQTGLNLKLTKHLWLNGGPSFSLFRSEQKELKADFQSFENKGFLRFRVNKETQGWLGYQAGLTWRYSGQ
jgi:hypothetical protein